MDFLSHDLRLAVRSLTKSPGFTAVVILTLGLGIGANTTMFSVVDGVLLASLPFRDADRLVMIWQNDRLRGTTQEGVSGPDFIDYQQRSTIYEEIAAFTGWSFILTGGDGKPERIRGGLVSHDLFKVVGWGPELGRAMGPEDDQLGVEPVVLLSHGLWQRRYGADPNVMGQTITLDGEAYSIIGVMPHAFAFPSSGTEVWTPLLPGPYRNNMSLRGNHSLMVIARLREGASLEQANVEIAQIMNQLEKEYPDDNLGRGAWAQPLIDASVGNVRPALLALMGAVGLVLLIACANVANLLLSRALSRQREVAIRTALGASRARVGRQFLTESLLLGLFGGALGIALAYTGLNFLLALGGYNLPRTDNIALDLRVLGFTLLVSVATGLLFGLVPAMQAAKADIQANLKEGSGGAVGQGGHPLRRLLVVSELALAVILVVGAGLLIRSFWQLQQVDPGFEASRLITLGLQLPASKYSQDFEDYPSWPQITHFYAALLDRLERLPGVDSVAVAQEHPLSAGWTTRFTIDGRPALDPGEQDEARIRAVGAEYFRTTGIQLLAGRMLTDADREGAPPVIIINEAMVRRYFKDQDPIGQRISFWGISKEIVGVVADVKFRGLDQTVPIAMYPSIQQVPMNPFSVVVRTSGDPSGLIHLIQEQVWDLDQNLPVSNVNTLESLLSNAVARPRFNTVLLTTFALVALLLAAVGLYGVISYGVSQRTREIGVRMSLGARRADILRLIVAQGFKLAVAGIAIGLIGSLALNRVISSLLFGVAPTDGVTLLIVPLLLAAVALGASYLPARRASRVDPIVALRYE